MLTTHIQCHYTHAYGHYFNTQTQTHVSKYIYMYVYIYKYKYIYIYMYINIYPNYIHTCTLLIVGDIYMRPDISKVG